MSEVITNAITTFVAKFSNTVVGKTIMVSGKEIWSDTLDKDGNKQFGNGLKAIAKPGTEFPLILSSERISNLLVLMPNLNTLPNVDYRLANNGSFDPKVCKAKGLPEGDWAIYVPETPEVAI